VLGLTAATPIRPRPVSSRSSSCQCGPIRHTAARTADSPHDLQVLPRSCFARIDLPPESGIQEVFRHLANDRLRTAAIAAESGRRSIRAARLLFLPNGLSTSTPSRWRWVQRPRYCSFSRSDVQEATRHAHRSNRRAAIRCAAYSAGPRQARRRRIRPSAPRYLVLAMPIS